ncbi:MAG TPA: hypothetical protein VFB20_12285 [Burkholderiales bacterium]|nr:hypothetical protein [Burkholderiales bacterium]
MRRLPVVRVVDELVGIGAYMDVTALNRLMREGASRSGAYLRIDPRESARLYGTLKRLPAVASVTFRDALRQSFQEIHDRSLTMTTVINVLFACVIAFGVVYNGAHRALRARQRTGVAARASTASSRRRRWSRPRLSR